MELKNGTILEVGKKYGFKDSQGVVRPYKKVTIP